MPVDEAILAVAVASAALFAGLLVNAQLRLRRRGRLTREARSRADRAVQHALAEELAREAAEQAMRSSEGRIHAILEAAVDAIITIDEHGRIQSFNRAAERIFQYDAGEVLGANVSRLMPEPYRSAHDLYLKNYLSTGQARIIGIGREVRGRRKDGTTFPMHLAVGESRLDGQRVFAGILRDLSESKRTAERLYESEERFRLLVHGVPDYGIALLDANGNVTSWNKGAERIYGWRADEMLGKPFVVTSAPEESAAGESERQLAVAKRDGSFEGEARRTRKDGITFWSHLTISTLKDDLDGLRGYFVIDRDMTEQREHEAMLREAKERAERANLAKSRFLAAASHDLRQPVQALMFFTAALGLRLKDEQGAGMLSNLEKSLEGLNTLLESLLDVSKLDAGVISPQIEEFPLAAVFQRLENEFGPAARQKGLRLTVVKSGEFIRSDPALLARILNNLLTNALRYTERGQVLVGARHLGETIRIEVWDNGIGIPEDRLEEIFQEFTQLGNPQRDRSQGLGLGLAVVQRLAQLLGHRIRVRSTLGRGSMFCLEVPRAARQRRYRTLAAENNDRLVLVIDDETTVLKGLGMILEAWGFEVLTATSEDEAIAQLESHGQRPSAILADYRLRDGHTGMEAIRHIRAMFDATIPSIIITGDTGPERLREAEASGFAIIHKPVQPPRLRSVLARSMSH